LKSEASPKLSSYDSRHAALSLKFEFTYEPNNANGIDEDGPAHVPADEGGVGMGTGCGRMMMEGHFSIHYYSLKTE
jgi:hypothetical protein